MTIREFGTPYKSNATLTQFKRTMGRESVTCTTYTGGTEFKTFFKIRSDFNKEICTELTNFIYLFEKNILWISKYKMDKVILKNIFVKMEIDYLLSFNYTTTYLNYNKEININNICYVHGIVDTNCTNNGIVMGVGSDFYDP